MTNENTILESIREQIYEREKRGQNREQLTCVLTRSQYDALTDDLNRFEQSRGKGPTTVCGLPIFVASDSTHLETPRLWKGEPPAFASEVNAQFP